MSTNTWAKPLYTLNTYSRKSDTCVAYSRRRCYIIYATATMLTFCCYWYTKYKYNTLLGLCCRYAINSRMKSDYMLKVIKYKCNAEVTLKRSITFRKALHFEKVTDITDYKMKQLNHKYIKKKDSLISTEFP